MGEKQIDVEKSDSLTDEQKVMEILQETTALYEKYARITEANNVLQGLSETAPSTSYFPYELV